MLSADREISRKTGGGAVGVTGRAGGESASTLLPTGVLGGEVKLQRSLALPDILTFGVAACAESPGFSMTGVRSIDLDQRRRASLCL